MTGTAQQNFNGRFALIQIFTSFKKQQYFCPNRCSSEFNTFAVLYKIANLYQRFRFWATKIFSGWNRRNLPFQNAKKVFFRHFVFGSKMRGHSIEFCNVIEKFVEFGSDPFCNFSFFQQRKVCKNKNIKLKTK